jgi:Uma2 family endonuclease
MLATLRLPQPSTYSHYLAVEQNSVCRHEFLDGVIVAMAGGSPEHNALSGRMAMLVGMRVGGACRFFSSDQRFWIAGRARGRYADGSVICGPPDRPAHDAQAATNPSLVIEVLSPSTQGDDEGDKRVDFQSLWSLQAYVLVSQSQRWVAVHRRSGDGKWRVAPDVYASGDAVPLPILTSAIAVDDVYDNILDDDGRSRLG